MFLSAACTLILTAPIYCRGTIGEQVILLDGQISAAPNKHIIHPTTYSFEWLWNEMFNQISYIEYPNWSCSLY